MLTAIIDYESGNLHSAEKAFQRMAAEVGAGDVVVTGDADVEARADRVGHILRNHQMSLSQAPPRWNAVLPLFPRQHPTRF